MASKIDQWLENKKKNQPSTIVSGASSQIGSGSKIDQWLANKEASNRSIPEPTVKARSEPTSTPTSQAAAPVKTILAAPKVNDRGQVDWQDAVAKNKERKAAGISWQDQLQSDTKARSEAQQTGEKPKVGAAKAIEGSLFKGWMDWAANSADWWLGNLQATQKYFGKMTEDEKDKYLEQAGIDALNQGDLWQMGQKDEAPTKKAADTLSPERKKLLESERAALIRRPDESDTGAIATARRTYTAAQQSMSDMTGLEQQNNGVQLVGQAVQSLPTTVASRMGPAGVAISGSAAAKQAYNQKYDEMMEKYGEVDLDRLMTYSIGAAAVESASEYIFPAGKKAASVGYGALKRAGDDVFTNGVRSVAKWLAKDGDNYIIPTAKAFGKSLLAESSQEGMEEVVSYVGQGLLAKWLTNPEDKLFGDILTAKGAGESFIGGAVAGALFSGVAATPGFVQSRQWLKQNTHKKISDLTDADIKEIYRRAEEDYATPEGQQSLKSDLVRAVAKTQATGQTVQDPQSGETFDVLKPTEDGKVSLLGQDGGTDIDMTVEEFQQALENNILIETQATPASDTTMAVNDSSLPVGQQAPQAAVTPSAAPDTPSQAQQQTMAGVATSPSVPISERVLANGEIRRQAEVPVVDQQTGKQAATVQVYQTKGKVTILVSRQGDLTPKRFEFDPDSYPADIDPVLAVNEATNGVLGSYGRDSIPQGAQRAFYDAVSDATRSILADNQQRIQADRQSKEAEVQAKTEAKQESDRRAGMSETQRFKEDNFKNIDEEVRLGMYQKDDIDALKSANEDLDKLGIDGYMRPLKAKDHTKVMREIQKIMKDVSGKRVVFIESVGADQVNEFVNDFSKDTVFVNTKGRTFKDALFAVGHGLHHLMVKDGNGNVLTKTVVKFLGQDTIDAYVDEFDGAYKDRLANDTDKAVEEIVADRCGEMFKSPKFWRTLSDTAPSKKRARIFDSIADYLERVGEVSTTLDSEIAAFQKAINQYKDEVLKEEMAEEEPASTVNQETKQQTAPDVPKSFMMGKKVQTSIRPNEYIDVQYAIVSARELIASNNINGDINPLYNSELQPRDRERMASNLAINEIINKIDPRQLVGNESAKNGAPIVGKDGMVESGNGRIIALQELYRTRGSGSKKYRDYIEQNAPDYGIDGLFPSDPILVRVRLSDIDRIGFVHEANVRDQAAMSATEQAKVDSDKLDLETLSMFEASDDGRINTAANRDFIKSFVARVIPSTERNAVLQEDGSLSADGLSRIRNALFFKAYGSVRMMNILAEETDSDMKNIVTAMVQAAPKIVQVKAEISRGAAYDMDLSADLAWAAEKYNKLDQTRLSGMNPVESYLSQQQLVPEEGLNPVSENLLKFYYEFRSKRKALHSFMVGYYNGVMDFGNPKEQSLFGETTVPSRNAYIEESIKKERSKYETESKQQAEATDSLPLFVYAEGNAGNASLSSESSGTQTEPAAQEVKPKISKGDYINIDGFGIGKVTISSESGFAVEIAGESYHRDLTDTDYTKASAAEYWGDVKLQIDDLKRESSRKRAVAASFNKDSDGNAVKNKGRIALGPDGRPMGVSENLTSAYHRNLTTDAKSAADKAKKLQDEIESRKRILITKIESGVPVDQDEVDVLGINIKPSTPKAKAEAAKNSYEQKQQAKAQRYRELAEKARRESSQAHAAMRKIQDNIPLGQPILVGHHSEKRHRGDLNKIDNYMAKAVDRYQKAEEYERKAESAENNKAISSDDPQAIKKLQEKLKALEAKRESIKRQNIDRKKKGQEPYPPYVLQNLGNNIRSVKQRIESLEKLAEKEAVQGESKITKFDGFDLVENFQDNRLQLMFDGKPKPEVIESLKKHGFRWAPSTGSWQRQLTENAKYSVRSVLRDMGVKFDDGKTQYSITPEERAQKLREHSANRLITDKYMSAAMQSEIKDYAKVYFAQSNNETARYAIDKLNSDYEKAIADALDIEKAGAINTYIRMTMFEYYDGKGDAIEAARWFTILQKGNKEQGQGVQANVMADNPSLFGNMSWAKSEIEAAITKPKKKAIEAKTAAVTKELHDIDVAAANKVLSEQEALLEQFEQLKSEAKRKEKALKRLEDRIKKYQEELGEFDADAVKTFIDTLHGVATVTQQYDKLPKTSDPVAFMKWVLNNTDKLHESWLSAYRIVRNMHGMDEVFMAEIDAYFGDFIPDHRFDHPAPALDLTPENYDAIKSAVLAHYSEDFRTFNAMVHELNKMGLDMQNAVLVARMVQKQIADLTREEKARALRKILKSSRKNLDETINKIINLSNEKGLQNDEVAAFVARMMDLPGLTPELINLISENSKKISDIKKNMLDEGRTTMTDAEKREIAILKAEIVAAVQRMKKSTFLQKVDLTESISLMSNPKTIMRNIVGNFGFAITDTGKDYIAAGIDRAVGKITGEKTVPIPQMGVMIKGFARGAKEAKEDILRGIDTSSLDTGYSVPRADVYTSKFGQTVMKGFRFAMQLPDRAFQAAAFDSHLVGLMKMKGITDPAQVTQDMIEAAQYAAAYKTFTDDNFLNGALGTLRNKILNAGKGWGVGSIILKFTHVPASILMRTIDYSPVSFMQALWYMGKPMYDAKVNGTSYKQEFQQRKFAVALANGVYGSAVTIGLGVLLTSLGLMTGKPDDDQDKRALNNAMGIGRGYMMNWSGLWRLLTTLDVDKCKPQAGDVWSTYSWFSPMNIGIGMGANIVHDTRNAKDSNMTTWEYLATTGWTSVTSGVESITEMSVLSGLNNYMRNIGYGDDPVTALVKSAAGVPSNFIPQFVKGIREVFDNTMRDTYDTNIADYVVKLMQNKVPGMSKWLAPAEPDALGNLREVYQNNGNNLWNVFFNPAIVTRYTPNADAIMVYNTIMEAEEAGLDKQNVIANRVGKELAYKTVGPAVQLTDNERYNLTAMIRKEAIKRFAQIPPNLSLERKYEEMNNIMNRVSQDIKKGYQAYKLAQAAKGS